MYSCPSHLKRPSFRYLHGSQVVSSIGAVRIWKVIRCKEVASLNPDIPDTNGRTSTCDQRICNCCRQDSIDSGSVVHRLFECPVGRCNCGLCRDPQHSHHSRYWSSHEAPGVTDRSSSTTSRLATPESPKVETGTWTH
jgi:hypothetical protein